MGQIYQRACRTAAIGALVGVPAGIFYFFFDRLGDLGPPTPALYMIGLPLALLRWFASLPLVGVVAVLGFNWDEVWILPANLILCGFAIGLFRGRRRARRLMQFSAFLQRCEAGKCSKEELQLARDIRQDQKLIRELAIWERER
jgi:hypothetical protein